MPLDQENFGYNATVMDHFQNPRNAGDMENPSCIGLARNSDCGDLLKLYLRIEDERIVDAKFKTYGCGAAIASSSKLTEMLIGRTLEAAARIKNTDVAEALVLARDVQVPGPFVDWVKAAAQTFVPPT